MPRRATWDQPELTLCIRLKCFGTTKSGGTFAASSLVSTRRNSRSPFAIRWSCSCGQSKTGVGDTTDSKSIPNRLACDPIHDIIGRSAYVTVSARYLVCRLRVELFTFARDDIRQLSVQDISSLRDKRPAIQVKIQYSPSVIRKSKNVK